MNQDEAHNDIFKFELQTSNPLMAGASGIVFSALERVLSLRQLRGIYDNISGQAPEFDFVDKALEALNVQCDISDQDLASIPSSGPVIVVANHPFGGIEGLLLASMLKKVRRDVKLIANYLLSRIPELRSLLISVDPFGGREAVSKNIKSLKDAISWMREGGVLGIFPAGEVSHLHLRKGRIDDPPWSLQIARLIKKVGVPVLPVFFHGSNGALFQLSGLVHPRLRTIMLPRELYNKRGARVRVSVGKLIPPAKLTAFENETTLATYIRTKTYLLRYRNGRDVEKDGSHVPPVHERTRVKDHSKDRLLATEVEKLPSDQMLHETDEFSVMFARAEQIPNLLYEIGVLREQTFRRVGEGTGKPVDVDRFDLYYIHIFLWHKERQEVAGAYRLGPIDIILDRFGPQGLYTSTLFNYKSSFFNKVGKAIELGRSFVRPEYQRSYLPLLFLWKGIAKFVAQKPEYTVLFGPVTISNLYHAVSKDLMFSFLNRHRSDAELARLVTPKTPFKGRSGGLSHELLFCGQDLEELSSTIAHIETDRKGVPVLLRQYLKLGGKLLGFNVDRKFSEALDGLILVDLKKCEPKVLARYMGKKETEAFLALHGVPCNLSLRKYGIKEAM